MFSIKCPAPLEPLALLCRNRSTGQLELAWFAGSPANFFGRDDLLRRARVRLAEYHAGLLPQKLELDLSKLLHDGGIRPGK